VVFGYAFSVYHRLLDELHGSEARSRALLHAIPDLIIRFDLDGTLLDFQAHEDSPDLKPPPPVIVGANIYESPMRREVVDQIMCASRRAVETGDTQTVEFSYSKETEPRHYEARIVASGDNELVSIVRNITERKQAEDTIRQSQQDLRALAGRLLSAKEEESKRLARELHDAFSQRLAVLGMEVGALEQQLGSPSGSPRQSLQRMGEEIGEDRLPEFDVLMRRMAQEVRRLSEEGAHVR